MTGLPEFPSAEQMGDQPARLAWKTRVKLACLKMRELHSVRKRGALRFTRATETASDLGLGRRAGHARTDVEPRAYWSSMLVVDSAAVVGFFRAPGRCHLQGPAGVDLDRHSGSGTDRGRQFNTCERATHLECSTSRKCLCEN